MDNNPFRSESQKFESKDVKPFVTSISREDVRNLSQLEQTKPSIFLPEEFYAATEQMCRAEKETRGVFLVPRHGEATSKGRLGIVAMIAIGYGSSTQVYPDEAKLNAINRLLREHGTEVMPIDFHTHTIATGEAWRNTFSGQDEQSIANNVNRSQGYMHVLFTPTNILTFGKGKPQFAVTNFDGTSPIEKQNQWTEKFEEYLRQG